MNLEDFLEHKGLFYDKIDYTIIKKSWDILSQHIKLPFVIHIIGTNGKGSTGRFLATFLKQENKSVVHYSSPHVEKFNERIWLDGSDSSDELLESTHETLQKILPKEYLDKLTYFEYTTLMAFYISSNKDYIVLEAGLGGEFDATNVVPNDLTLLTTIGLDHQSFLGDTIELITGTKVRSCDKAIIVGYQKSDLVLDVVKEQLEDKEICLYDDNLDVSFYEDSLPSYLLENLKLSLSCLNYLGFEQREYTLPKLFARYQRYQKNIILDVGHNSLAASVIANELKNEKEKITLIYNTYADKDYDIVLDKLKPYIKEIQIIQCDDSRIIETDELKKIIKSKEIKCQDFSIENFDENNIYLVFGSFLVVENFLKVYNER